MSVGVSSYRRFFRSIKLARLINHQRSRQVRSRLSCGIPNDQLPTYLNSHDVFLNTTNYESFGMAVLEAAACGIPIVSTSVGELPLLWEDEKEILLTKAITAEAFSHPVSRLLDDSKLAQQLSQNARKKSEQFDWEVIKLKWLELFKNHE